MKPLAPIDLRLDGNEGAAPPKIAIEAIRSLEAEVVRRYPERRELEAALAARHGVAPEQVIVTAGGDESIDRLCRAYLCPGRAAIVPAPSFEMIERYVHLASANLIEIEWPPGEPYPVEDAIAVAGPGVAMVFIVSPNNPTGAVACAEDLRRLSAAAPQSVIVVDLAYTEFADIDLTPAALALPNAVVVRTLSKAWAMAGLRVGYAIGPRAIIDCLRVCGGPFSVSGPSIAIANAALTAGASPESMAHVATYVDEVRRERAELVELLRSLHVESWESQGNFVLARAPRWEWLWLGLAAFGIAVRPLGDRPRLRDCLRITCPGRAELFARLTVALQTVLRPQSILFTIDAARAMLSERGASSEQPEPLRRLAARASLAVLSNGVDRAAADLASRLRLESGVQFDVVDSATADGVRAALRSMGIERAWTVVAGIDDLAIARGVGALPVGLCGPGQATSVTAESLQTAGAGPLISNLEDLARAFP